MSISRTGGCPPFLEYVTRQALIPRFSGPVNQSLMNLAAYGSFRWIEIPSYQRGVVWDDELFEKLLESSSQFMGNAVLGDFKVDRNVPGFANLPPGVREYEILIDGLQRFTIGTALLALLDPFVFQDPPMRAGDAAFFGSLIPHARMFAPVYQHNDRELMNHPRGAVRDSYRAFRALLGRWLGREFDAGHASQLARKLNNLFLERQIAPDTYHGFSGVYEVTSTFIGLNTTRVELNVVDWLRSIIVDQGASRTSGWTPAVTEATENQFTEVFCGEGGIRPIAELKPFANEVKEQLVNGNSHQDIFPSWSTGLLQSEVDDFLGFVQEMYECDSSPYLNELRECGAGPFAISLAYYYREFRQTGQKPSFLQGGQAEDTALQTLLRATYRMVLNGNIGRTASYIGPAVVRGKTLCEIANDMSNDYIHVSVTQPLDRDWLKARLRYIDKKDAPRIFNACMISAIGQPLSFRPHVFGRKANHYQVDHMIPESAILANQPGEVDCRLLANFAPIRRHVNNRQTNLPCSQKMGRGGTYEGECANDPTVHPYVAWLVQTEVARQRGALLDRQDYLTAGVQGGLGDERIDWLADHLVGRV